MLQNSIIIINSSSSSSSSSSKLHKGIYNSTLETNHYFNVYLYYTIFGSLQNTMFPTINIL